MTAPRVRLSVAYVSLRVEAGPGKTTCVAHLMELRGLALELHNCVVPSDPHVFAQFGKLELVTPSSCHTPDGTRITALDVPGVHTVVS